MSTNPTTFTPTPTQADAILADLDDCSLSFNDLANKHGTNSDALALWLSTDPIRDRIQEGLDSMALRVRRLATGRLQAALQAVSTIVEDYNLERAAEKQHARPVPAAASRPPGSPPTAPSADTDDLAHYGRRLRRDESVRRACALLFRLANFFSPTSPPRPRLASPRATNQNPADKPANSTALPEPDLDALAAPLEAGRQNHRPVAPAPSSDRGQPASAPVAPAPAPRSAPSKSTPHHSVPSAPSVVKSSPRSNLPPLATPAVSAANPVAGLSLADLLPDGPLHVTSRAPASLTARAGACLGAAP